MRRTVLASLLTVALLIVGTATGVRAQDASGSSAGDVISAINKVERETNQLNAIDQLSAGDVALTNATEQLGGRSGNALTSAVQSNKDGIASLRSALESRSAVTSKLQESDLQVDDVVGTGVNERESTVTLYFVP